MKNEKFSKSHIRDLHVLKPLCTKFKIKIYIISVWKLLFSRKVKNFLSPGNVWFVGHILYWTSRPRDIFRREDIGKKVLECDSTSCGRNPDEKYSKTKKLGGGGRHEILNNFFRRHFCPRRHVQKSLRMCFYVLWTKPRWKILKDKKVRGGYWKHVFGKMMNIKTVSF